MREQPMSPKWKVMIGIIVALALIGILDFKGIGIILIAFLVLIAVYILIPVIHFLRIKKRMTSSTDENDPVFWWTRERSQMYKEPAAPKRVEEEGPVIDLVEDENGRLVKAEEDKSSR